MKCVVTIILLVGLAAYTKAAAIDFSSTSALALKTAAGEAVPLPGLQVGDVMKMTCTTDADHDIASIDFFRGGTIIFTMMATHQHVNSHTYIRTLVNADVGTATSFQCQYKSSTLRAHISAPRTVKINQPVEPDSILISKITSTSANVTWKAPQSDVSFTVSIIPTAEGAWVDPNPVPRGTTKVTLRNLTPGTVYQITIWTIFDSTTLRGQSKKSFQTPANILVPKDVQPEALSTAGLAVAVTCLVIIIILIVLIVIIFRRIDRLATHNDGTGNDTHLPMSNLGFERDHQPRKIPTPVVGKSSDFRTWLLSKQISEDTYEVLQREGFQDPAMFAFLKPEAVSRLAIRPMAQELLLTDIVESFNKGETPFQTCGTAGDELYDDVTNEKYEHLRVA